MKKGYTKIFEQNTAKKEVDFLGELQDIDAYIATLTPDERHARIIKRGVELTQGLDDYMIDLYDGFAITGKRSMRSSPNETARRMARQIYLPTIISENNTRSNADDTAEFPFIAQVPTRFPAMLGVDPGHNEVQYVQSELNSLIERSMGIVALANGLDKNQQISEAKARGILMSKTAKSIMDYVTPQGIEYEDDAELYYDIKAPVEIAREGLRSVVSGALYQAERSDFKLPYVIKSNKTQLARRAVRIADLYLKKLIEEGRLDGSEEEYGAASLSLYGGDMNRVFLAAEALTHKASTKGVAVEPLAWNRFIGTFDEYELLRAAYDPSVCENNESAEYQQIVKSFCGGNTQKAYVNIKAVARSHGHDIFESMTINPAKARVHNLERVISEGIDGVEAYKRIATKMFKGSMINAYVYVNSHLEQSGRDATNWTLFKGSVRKFEKCEELLRQGELDGIDNYKATAIAQNNGNMKRAFENLQVVASLTGMDMPDWTLFDGEVKTFAIIQQLLEERAASDIENYQWLAEDYFDGDMGRAYDAVRVVANAANLPMVDWQRIEGKIDK